VSRREQQRLLDVQAAIAAIASHIERGDVSDGLVFDAVRVRLIEIGEAVKALPSELLDYEPGLPWSEIARMRDHLGRERVQEAEHLRCLLQRPEDRPAVYEGPDRVHVVLQGGRDAEVAAAAAEPPQQLGFAVRVGTQPLAVGRNQVGRAQVVDGSDRVGA
jgi:hypothetical protein